MMSPAHDSQCCPPIAVLLQAIVAITTATDVVVVVVVDTTPRLSVCSPSFSNVVTVLRTSSGLHV